MRLENKVVVVAGAGGRQGTAVPLLFAREGAKIALAGLDDDELARIAAVIGERGGEAVHAALDLTSADGAEAAVRLALDRLGRIDVLYNNTGVYLGAEMRTGDTSREDWERILAIDLTSHFLCAHFALREMVRQQSGVVINVAAARAARLGGNLAYAAAKSAIIGMTKKMAREYLPDNIRVNCICPTNIQGSPDPMNPGLPQSSLVRDGAPEDVAHAALFLASDEAKFITGAILPVDGGMSAGVG